MQHRTRGLGLAVAGLLVSGCASKSDAQLPVNDFAIAFLVVTDATGTNVEDISAPLLNADLETMPTENSNPKIKVVGDQRLFVVTVPEGSAMIEDVCWDRPVQLQAPNLEGMSSGMIQFNVERALDAEVAVAFASEFRAGDSELGPLVPRLPTELPWMGQLVLRMTVDGEWSRSAHGPLRAFETPSGAQGANGFHDFLNQLNRDPNEPRTYYVRDTVWLDDRRVLILTNLGMAVVEQGQSFSPDNGRWLTFPTPNESFLERVALGTTLQGEVEIIAVGGWARGSFDNLLVPPNPPEFFGVAARAHWTEANGLQWVEIKDLGPYRFHSVAIEDQEVFVGAAGWLRDAEGNMIRRQPLVYRWEFGGPIPEVSEPWHAFLLSGEYRNDDARRVAITGHPQFRYVMTARSSVSVRDEASGNWSETFLLPNITGEDQDYVGLGVAPDDPAEWWLTSDNGYIFRTTNAGQDWQQIIVNYPSRFGNCGGPDPDTGALGYRQKPIHSVRIVNDHVFIAPTGCKALVSINRNCRAFETQDPIECVSLIVPSDIDLNACDELENPQQCLLVQHVGVFETDQNGPLVQARVGLRTRGDRLLTTSLDGTILVAEPESGTEVCRE